MYINRKNHGLEAFACPGFWEHFRNAKDQALPQTWVRIHLNKIPGWFTLKFEELCDTTISVVEYNWTHPQPHPTFMLHSVFYLSVNDKDLKYMGTCRVKPTYTCTLHIIRSIPSYLHIYPELFLCVPLFVSHSQPPPPFPPPPKALDNSAGWLIVTLRKRSTELPDPILNHWVSILPCRKLHTGSAPWVYTSLLIFCVTYHVLVYSFSTPIT